MLFANYAVNTAPLYVFHTVLYTQSRSIKIFHEN